jgi:hypothetical protein
MLMELIAQEVKAYKSQWLCVLVFNATVLRGSLLGSSMLPGALPTVMKYTPINDRIHLKIHVQSVKFFFNLLLVLYFGHFFSKSI